MTTLGQHWGPTRELRSKLDAAIRENAKLRERIESLTAEVAKAKSVHETHASSKCGDCGLPYADCCCDEWEEDDEQEREEWPRCGCQYCFCHTRTEYGEPCSSCVNNAHQG